YLTVNLLPTHQKLNHRVTIRLEVAARLDTCFDHSFNFIRPFLNFLFGRYYSAPGVGEKLIRPCKNIEPHLRCKKIKGNWDSRRIDQPLLKTGKTTFGKPSGRELYVFLRVQTEMPEHEPRVAIRTTTRAANRNSF